MEKYEQDEKLGCGGDSSNLAWCIICLFVRILGKKLVWFPLLRLCIVYNMYHGVLVVFSPMLLFVGEKCGISFS